MVIETSAEEIAFAVTVKGALQHIAGVSLVSSVVCFLVREIFAVLKLLYKKWRKTENIDWFGKFQFYQFN